MNELDLFTAALAIPNSAERNAFLDRECAGNFPLRERLAKLVEAHLQSHPLLDQPVPAGLGQTQAFIPSEQPGAIIAGRYKLLEEIGEGGMGTVWVAEQTEPVRRKVALKLIKAGMDSRSVLARFEAERQALAVMDHPNIAKVLDGGLTETGRPYFVMEYVKGVPITEYCDATRLSVQDRLNLFVQVCQAVQHAHQKGIIHRDLKPSNILVAPYDDKPVPKVIDFGLAKAMHQSLTERTLHTAHETVLGTPLYMSPEQAQLNNIDVDTRSDIYSLGVLLYELLTGTTPLEKQRFKEAAWDEVRRIIREEEPPRPSARLSSTSTLPSLAAGRQIEPARLTKLVRGELDWIVMKSLEKDRSRRYETANGFAADVQRYLAGEPVLAAPPSATYQLKKFVGRHKGKVIAGSLGLLALLVAMAGAAWGLMEARQKVRWLDVSNRAINAEREAKRLKEMAILERQRAQEAEMIAVQEKERSEQQAEAVELAKAYQTATHRASEILGSIFENLDQKELAMKERSLQVILVEKLDEAAAQLEGELIDDPGAYAMTHEKIGKWLMRLGEPSKAIVLQEKVRAAWHAKLGPDHPETLRSIRNLAAAYLEAGQGAKAAPIVKEFFVSQRKRYPNDDPALAGLLEEVTLDLLKYNQFAEAEPLFRECLNIREKTQPDVWLTFNTKSLLGGALLGQKKYADAEPLLRTGYEGMKSREKSIPPLEVARLREALDRLIDLYTATDKPDEVKKWQAERAKYPQSVQPQESK